MAGVLGVNLTEMMAFSPALESLLFVELMQGKTF
jgi:hypothetical protein